jgi:NitT/TauT family transport system permease protein
VLLDPRKAFGGNPEISSRGLAFWAVVVATFNSAWRVLAGMLAALIIAVPVGLFIGMNRWADRLLAPIANFMAPLSPVAWVPFAVTLLAMSGNARAVFLVFISVVFLLTIVTSHAVRNVDKSLLVQARSLGAGPLAVIFRVIVPASLPAIFVMLRINFFAAWMSVLIAESAGLRHADWGLGNLIVQGRQSYDPPLVLAVMVILALVGFVLDRALLLVQRKFLWWRRDVAVAYE